MKLSFPNQVVIRSWWAVHGTTLLRLAVALMAILALLKLGDEFRRLVWESGRIGAIDLKLYHKMVHHWFAGLSIYGVLKHAEYLPASYVILWPFLGWLAVTPARWLWAATTVVALGWLVFLIVRESGADTPLERVFVALMFLSMNATGVTVGNGQLIVHLLPALVAGLVLLHRRQRRWREDVLAAVLVLATLVKPTTSVPFFWIVLFVSGNLRPALLILLGYGALTLFAASFQEFELVPLLYNWFEYGVGRGGGVSVTGGYAHTYNWLATLGLQDWNLLASLLVLATLGLWTYRHRHRDLWLLLGVTALVARFWTYHRLYDDLLILLPMIALFRIAKRDSSADGSDVVAGVLLAITMLAMLAPARLRFAPSPWYLIFTAGTRWSGSLCSSSS